MSFSFPILNSYILHVVAIATVVYFCKGKQTDNHDFGQPSILGTTGCSDNHTDGGSFNYGSDGAGDIGGGGGGAGGGWGNGGRSKCAPLTSLGRVDLEELGLEDFIEVRGRKLSGECEECSSDDVKVAFDIVRAQEVAFLKSESAVLACGDTAADIDGYRSLYPCILQSILPIANVIPALLRVLSCESAREQCYGDLTQLPGQFNLIIQNQRFENFLELALVPFGGNLSLPVDTPGLVDDVKAHDFNSKLNSALAETSESQEAISKSELTMLEGIDLSLPAIIDLKRFSELWNRSLLSWEQGNFVSNASNPIFDVQRTTELFSQVRSNFASILREGFSSFSEAWTTAVEGQQFEKARLLAGVCANIRIKIEQEVTLTRIGFQARLEVSNDGTAPLEDFSVSLRINPFNRFDEDKTDLFVFGDPELLFVTSVNGNGRIEGSTDASISWLILPLTEAAPEFDTRYDVSGVMLYTIDGIEYIQNLAPDTITVRPDPRLFLTYFWSRIAYADDPFTLAIEPSVPFQLAVLVENKGFGDARDLQIASSQPEIVENEKGLLIDFTIIGSRLGNTPTSNTLNVDFGTVQAKNNSICVWDIVSSLKGTFSNFSATFRYEGPIDDERLSLIEAVKIYELTHLVRVTGDHPAMPSSLGYEDDGLDDFLSNVFPDALFLPDTVFTSDTRQSNFSVSSVIDEATVEAPVVDGSDETVTVLVEHNLSVDDQANLFDWVYIRFIDPMGGTEYILQSATRVDFDYTLFPNQNSWQTSWRDLLDGGEVDRQDHIHLFDFGVAPKYLLLYRKQQPVSNLKVTDATDDSISISWEHAAGASACYIVVRRLCASAFVLATEFIQVESYTLTDLTPGTEFEIRVFTGDRGNWESTGATVIGTTNGTSLCGNSILDAFEECDEGSVPSASCRAGCVKQDCESEDTHVSTAESTPGPTPGPTDESTLGPTQGSTDESTLRPTQGSTDESTPGPTQVSTDESTTQVPTPGPTDESTTQVPTPGPTEGSTTESTTQVPTLGPTEGSCCESTTQVPTPGPTQGSTSESTTLVPTLGPTQGSTSESTTQVPTLGPTQGSTAESTPGSTQESSSGRTVCLTEVDPLPECEKDQIWTIVCSGHLYICGNSSSIADGEICERQTKSDPHQSIISLDEENCAAMITGLLANPFEVDRLCPTFYISGGLEVSATLHSFVCYGDHDETPCDNYREIESQVSRDPCGLFPPTPMSTLPDNCTCSSNEGT